MAERKSLLLRIPPRLWEELQRLAAADLRSVNAEIEYLLADAVRRRQAGVKSDPGDESTQ
ncbi:MAG: hypothetical protein JNM85_00015 [Chthonomonas sp.]|nr:hypothetical protein [Chthonomonas sp.]